MHLWDHFVRRMTNGLFLMSRRLIKNLVLNLISISLDQVYQLWAITKYSEYMSYVLCEVSFQQYQRIQIEDLLSKQN
jgi:hypothetical protein